MLKTSLKLCLLFWVQLLHDSNTPASSAEADTLNLARYPLPPLYNPPEGPRVHLLHGTDCTYNHRVTYDPVVEDLLPGKLSGLGLAGP